MPDTTKFAQTFKEWGFVLQQDSGNNLPRNSFRADEDTMILIDEVGGRWTGPSTAEHAALKLGYKNLGK